MNSFVCVFYCTPFKITQKINRLKQIAIDILLRY